MRDPKRINKVLAAIGEVWEKNPDLRLGQLLSNVYRDPALYYIEDDKLVEEIKKYYSDLDISETMKTNDKEYEIGFLL